MVLLFEAFSVVRPDVLNASDFATQREQILALADLIRTVTRSIGLSRSRYYDWKHENPFGLDDRSSCPKKSHHSNLREHSRDFNAKKRYRIQKRYYNCE
jgi:hypothetical protein